MWGSVIIIKIVAIVGWVALQVEVVVPAVGIVVGVIVCLALPLVLSVSVFGNYVTRDEGGKGSKHCIHSANA